MEIYNTRFLNNKQRFWKSLLVGIATAIACSFLICYITQLTAQLAHMKFPILYVFSGYIIANAIQKSGGGIGKKYSYMGAALTFLCILLSELFYFAGYDIILHPQYWFSAIQGVISIWFSFQSNSIISIFFMIWGIYAGYKESDISNH